MKKRLLLTAVVMMVGFSVWAQLGEYRVYFNDKGENQAILNQPHQFLSAQAIARKALRQIPVTQSDLPVSSNYLNTLKARGAEVKMASRWFNFALVETADITSLAGLPFVKRVEAVERNYKLQITETGSTKSQLQLEYGIARNQTEMLNGDYLHQQDFLGEGMTIAVLDGGFTGANVLHGLDSLFNSPRFKGSYSFVSKDSNVFNGVGSHGTYVLSIMAGFIPDTFAGTAIKANYWLFTTEDQASETPVEMENWLMAAEKSDSLGVDIITSSLGYNKFDGGIGDYDFEDMDGNTTLVTRAADMAAAKGMLVVVSAGNEGSSPWERITAPADGDSVLAVGGVKSDEVVASFSSRGPTADGRIKPDVMAQGQGTAFISSAGPTGGNGTSFSCPVISGLAACLWQSKPGLSNMDIYTAIKYNADQHYTPNNTYGFGIANFRDASWAISVQEPELEHDLLKVYPNPVGDRMTLELAPELQGELECSIFDLGGKVVLTKSLKLSGKQVFELEAPEHKGTYILSLRHGETVYLRKIVK